MPPHYKNDLSSDTHLLSFIKKALEQINQIARHPVTFYRNVCVIGWFIKVSYWLTAIRQILD